jgi:putative DNA primase/helicase
MVPVLRMELLPCPLEPILCIVMARFVVPLGFDRHRSALLGKYDARAKGPVPVNCPPQIADAYMKRKGRWRLRPLMGIVNAPTFRPDGSLLDQPSHDPATALLYIPQPGVEFPGIPASPSRDDALAALGVLDEF